MDIVNLIKAGGYVHDNPEYNPKTKKGKLQPQYIVNADPNGAINQGSALAGVMSQPGRQGLNLDYLGSPEKYAEYDVTISPVDASLEKELAEAQGAFHKFRNAIAQAVVSEVGLGTVKGLSDLADVIGSKVLGVTDDDYSNPVSEYLAQLQEDFKNYSPIYSDPDKNIFNGGLVDAGWWASNLPSIMSSLTLMIPSTGITKGLGWVGKSINTATKGKLGAFGRNTYKAMTGASKAKTIEEAEKLNKVTKWLNNPNTIESGKRMAELGFNAALMRTMENYQEAHQVYSDMRDKALEKFNSMTDEQYVDFINNQADKLEGVDVSNKEEVANILAKQSADRTFAMDYANTIFDVIQLNALRNPIKLLKNMRANASIEEVQRRSTKAIGKAALASTEIPAEKAGLTSTIKNFGKGAGQFLKDSSHEVAAELTEGIEEAWNFIAQEEGMHYGNVALGEDIDNGFTSRLGSYLRSPELYDAAFWGVLGGVVFQGLGSGLNRLSVAAERAYQQKKKTADDKTGEATNYSNFQELFETSENKRRIADINARENDFNDLVTRLKQIEDNSEDPFNLDENNNPIKLETETEKSIARERAISEYITGMTFRAMDNGNFDMLKAYLQDANIRQALEEVTGNENDGGAFIDSVINRMDHIAERYSQNLIALSNIARNVNIVSEDVVPIEYLQIIARDNTAAQIKLEDLDARISTYETSAANKKAVYGDKLDKSLDYKSTVQLVVLTNQLAQLRAKYKELSEDKTKQGVGRQIELDRIEKNIHIVENMIRGTEDANSTDALTKLIYSTVQADLINDKDAYSADLEALMRGDISAIIGEEKARDFEITDDKILRIFGEDKASGSYASLASDINSVFEGQYGLNNIDQRLGDDYVALAALNIEKAILNENVVMNEVNLQKKVNELHNDMLDARKKAISKSETILRELAKKYGRQEMADELEVGNVITWENEEDKKKYDDALNILNLTSANNQQLYDNIQYMLMMDDLIDRSQEAATPTDTASGESSSTFQNQNQAEQPLSSNNQSDLNNQNNQGQRNTLNQPQSEQVQQVQEKFDIHNPNNLVAGTLVANLQSKSPQRLTDDEIKDYLAQIDNSLANENDISDFNKQQLKVYKESLNKEIVKRQSTNSSTGRQESSQNLDNNGQPIPDTNREATKTLIGQEIMAAVRTAKQNGIDATEAINAKVQELNSKYGQDDEFKQEINRMATSWNNRAKKQGLAKDVVDLVLLASSVTEHGGKYNFPQSYLDAAEKFANNFLNAVNAKQFNGKKLVSFESMLRFANEQMEDKATAEFIYSSLKAWFEHGPKKDDYIVLDNMNDATVKRANFTEKELATERLGGVDVYRVQIDQFLERTASKAVIDKIQQGDILNAKTVDNGDIILMVGDVEVGRLPKPIDDGNGGFKKINNGWITDVSLSNGTVTSELRKVWEDILTNKTPTNDKINNYIYQIIAAKKTNADTKPIRDAIENDVALKSFFDSLKAKGIIDNKASNIELIDGLVSIWDYIDLTNPDEERRKEDIAYSLDLWFNKLYDSYATIKNSSVVGLDNLIFKVAKISDGDVIQVASNNLEGYDLCTLGDENEAFANVETTELGVIEQGSSGEIKTTANNTYSQPNGSTGSMWAILPNRGGVPGIIRGHMLKFLDTGKGVDKTAAGRIREAIQKEVNRRISNFVKDGDFDSLVQFIDLLFGTTTSTPLLAPIGGGKARVSKYPSDHPQGERIVISIKDTNGKFINFTINKDTNQYSFANKDFRDATEDNLKNFINDFTNQVLGASIFNADYNYFNSDAGKSRISGLATRDKDGNFVITIPNGTDNPLVERFPSFKHFVMQGGAAKWNTKVVNGSNFTPRSNNQLRNQVLNVSIEAKSSRPVEENGSNQITSELVNSGKAVDTLIENKFGKNSPIIKSLKEKGLIPSNVVYTNETLMKGDHPSNIWTSISQKKIYINDEFIKMMNKEPEKAIRKLIHEQLHLKLHGKGNRRKELLNRIQEIFNDFKNAIDNDTNVDAHLREYLFEHIQDNQERLEEFLVESLTNRELASYLNSVQIESPKTKTKQSIFDKILELLADIFDWKVTEGSLYEKEFKVLQGFTIEEAGITKEDTSKYVEGELQFKEEEPTETVNDEEVEDDFDEDDMMASSVQEDTAPSVNQFIESLSLEDRVNFNNLLFDGTVSMKCN